jgi:type I restriction enzyme S subunit
MLGGGRRTSCDWRLRVGANQDQESVREHIESRLTGTSPTMKNISKPALLDIRFPLPDVGTQHRLVREIDSARKIAASKRAEAAALRQSAWATFEAALFTPAASS